MSRTTGTFAFFLMTILAIGGILILQPGCVLAQKRHMFLTDGDNGRTVRLTVGSVLALKLTSQPGTGYTWTVVNQAGNILVPVCEPRLENPTEKLVGGKGWQIFEFKAVASGNGVLELRYERQWEKKAKPARSFMICVEVQ